MKKISGQALLLVLLTMAVILTVVLSIFSRSVTDVTVTSRQEEAFRAFSAAEAGIERALLTPTIGTFGGSLTNSSFSGEVSNFGSVIGAYVSPQEIASGESATVWFVGHLSNGELDCSLSDCYTGNSMKVCWGKDGTPSDQLTTPAVEVTVLYDQSPPIGVNSGDYSNVKIARSALDPYIGTDPTRNSNNFTNAVGGSCTIGDTSFAFSSTVNFLSGGLNIPCTATEGCLLAAKLRILYNDVSQSVGVDVSPGNLPSQGRRIESTGFSGESTRKIEVYQTFADLPPIFDAAVFSPSGIVK